MMFEPVEHRLWVEFNSQFAQDKAAQLREPQLKALVAWMDKALDALTEEIVRLRGLEVPDE